MLRKEDIELVEARLNSEPESGHRDKVASKCLSVTETVKLQGIKDLFSRIEDGTLQEEHDEQVKLAHAQALAGFSKLIN